MSNPSRPITIDMRGKDAPYKTMKNGQYGIITKWGIQTDPLGKLVRRKGRCLQVIGEPAGRWYPKAFEDHPWPSLRHRVLIIVKPKS